MAGSHQIRSDKDEELGTGEGEADGNSQQREEGRAVKGFLLLCVSVWLLCLPAGSV
jgi:hypothetical protein